MFLIKKCFALFAGITGIVFGTLATAYAKSDVGLIADYLYPFNHVYYRQCVRTHDDIFAKNQANIIRGEALSWRLHKQSLIQQGVSAQNIEREKAGREASAQSPVYARMFGTRFKVFCSNDDEFNQVIRPYVISQIEKYLTPTQRQTLLSDYFSKKESTLIKWLEQQDTIRSRVPDAEALANKHPYTIDQEFNNQKKSKGILAKRRQEVKVLRELLNLTSVNAQYCEQLVCDLTIEQKKALARLNDRIIAYYLTQFSPAQIQEMKTLFSSPAGKRLQELVHHLNMDTKISELQIARFMVILETQDDEQSWSNIQ